MALSNVQALDIVIGCVHGVSTKTPSPDDSLKDGGITDEPRLSAFNALVVADPDLGVKKHNHKIAPSALSGVAVDDTVQATADVVRANATPISAAERAPAGRREPTPAPARERRESAKTGKQTKRSKRTATSHRKQKRTGKKKAKVAGKRKGKSR